MSNKENRGRRIETDALPIADNAIVPRSSTSELEVYNGNGSSSSNAVINNNFLVSHQNNSATNLIFEGCSNITMGNTISLNWPSTSRAVVNANQPSEEVEDNMLYKKTPTISEMMKSTQQLNEKYLDMFCENFGSRYQAVSVLLNIPDLFFQRMYEDHFHRGTAEVIYQVLYQHFQTNQEIATVGWFTKFLWNNGFRKTVFTVKEQFKKLRQMDLDDD